MSISLTDLFSRCEACGASDIHLSAGQPPWFRVQGALTGRYPLGVLTAADTDELGLALVAGTMVDGTPDSARAALLASGAVDGAVTSEGGFRYRFNVFRENGATAVAFRRLDEKFLSLAELGLPPQLEKLTMYSDGLVIVSGPTGSGKSTTLASLIDIVNRTRDGHIITIEDPVEYVHESKRCLVQQRQIGRDATSFYSALVEALRQDPDTILVGEIREVETVRTALTAAETGHLVFTTLHSGSCVGAIERLVSVFPADEQPSVRRQLSLVLRGIFAQHLLPSSRAGARRVMCGELLFVTTGIANLIATGRSAQIASAIETGGAHGMQTMEQAVASLLERGLVDPRAASLLMRF